MEGRIIIRDYDDKTNEQEVWRWVSHWLENGADGAVERAQFSAENAAEAVGRLTQLLAIKGILTLDDVKFVAGVRGYSSGDEAVGLK